MEIMYISTLKHRECESQIVMGKESQMNNKNSE